MEILVKELLDEARTFLEQADIDDAINDSWLLAEFALGITKTSYYLNPEQKISELEAEKYRMLVIPQDLRQMIHLPQ